MIIYHSIIFKIRTFIEKFVEQRITHMLCSVTFSENDICYKILCKFCSARHARD